MLSEPPAHSSSGEPSVASEPSVANASHRQRGGGVNIVDAATMTTGRLTLTPLRADDADAMAQVLGDARIHEFIGGRPATVEQMRDRYARLAAGSGNPDQIWLNWIVREHHDTPVGTVQATLTRDVAAPGTGWAAEVAWVIGVPWQGRGYATAAARALVDWLRTGGARPITACVHPDHHASAAVAARAGLVVTSEEIDGERVWRLPDDPVVPG